MCDRNWRVIVQGPIRTCVGCRERAPAAELLRVVAGSSTVTTSVVTVLRPDPRRRETGRGAWVHLDHDCVVKAVQRRAFHRALKVTTVSDAADVLALVAQYGTELPAQNHRGPADRPESTQREGEKKHP